ncbi:oxidative damage protection protein [Shigella flexneri]
MSRTIFVLSCNAKQKARIFSCTGKVGKRIYNEISKEAWAQWQHKQTMLINEKKLNMMNVEHRKLLEQEMINFLFEGKDVHIEGYTPKFKNRSGWRASGSLQITNTTRTRNDEKISRACRYCAVAHLLFDRPKRQFL